MGLYTIKCVGCRRPFLWFSGDMSQLCGGCAKCASTDEIKRRRANTMRAYINEARTARIDRLASQLRVRECMAYDLFNGILLRYDFGYRDPASGQWRQYATESFWDHKPEGQELDEARKFNKRQIAKEIDRQCGAAVQPMPMSLPRHVISARHV